MLLAWIASGLLWHTSALAGPQAGQITVDPDHPAWFKYHGGGPLYMCGPGDPEGFLYRGTRNVDGTRSGDQMTLINKLIGTGANCIYLMAIRSHGGDGDATQNPFIDSDPSKSLNLAILNQWDTWFSAMDTHGIAIYFIFYDDSSKPYGKDLPPGGELSSQEAAFIDAMVNRFKVYKHLIWCVAEEYAEGLTPAHAAKVAERIRIKDDRQHPVAIHQNSGTSFDFNGNANLDQFAVQWNVNTASELHDGVLAAWSNTGGAVNINLAEFAGAGTGETLRHKLWSIAAGGAYSMVLGMDIESTPVSDLQACGRVVGFMQATRFNEAVPHDELALWDTDYLLADPGDVYIAYADGGSNFGVSMLSGNYEIRWYDPTTGVWEDAGTRVVSAVGDQVFVKPSGLTADAALYVSRTAPVQASGPSPASGASGVQLDAVLTWTPGVGSTSHVVYFGTSSPGTLFGSQTATTFDPGTLDPNETYYWRIDEVNEKGTTQGTVWSFQTRGLPTDFDGDMDVDQEDFGWFQLCFSIVGATGMAPECLDADLNFDDLVDQADALLFLNCFGGPNVLADPACLP